MLTKNADKLFHSVLDELYQAHLPSKHPFFSHLAKFPPEKLSSPILGEIYLRYQAACHSTRVMAYYIPHLDSTALRVRKLRIISDDDGLENGDTHHYQLSRAFARIGADFFIKDEEFGNLEQLQKILDPTTANFRARSALVWLRKFLTRMFVVALSVLKRNYEPKSILRLNCLSYLDLS